MQFPNAIASNFISDLEKIASGCDAASNSSSKQSNKIQRQGSYGRAEQDMAGKGMAIYGGAGHGMAGQAEEPGQNRVEYQGRAGFINI
jgi:hypothetical protein